LLTQRKNYWRSEEKIRLKVIGSRAARKLEVPAAHNWGPEKILCGIELSV
jgi:hypothetical protein